MSTPPPSPSAPFSPPLPTPLSVEEDEDLNECLNHLFTEPLDYVSGISDLEIEELLGDTSMELDMPTETSSPPKQIKSVAQVRRSSKKVKHRRNPALKCNKKTKSSSKKKSKIPFIPTLEPVPEKIIVGPCSPDVSETEEPNSSDSDSETRITLSPVIQVITIPDPVPNDDSDTVQDMILATPPLLHRPSP